MTKIIFYIISAACAVGYAAEGDGPNNGIMPGQVSHRTIGQVLSGLSPTPNPPDLRTVVIRIPLLPKEELRNFSSDLIVLDFILDHEGKAWLHRYGGIGGLSHWYGPYSHYSHGEQGPAPMRPPGADQTDRGHAPDASSPR